MRLKTSIIIFLLFSCFGNAQNSKKSARLKFTKSILLNEKIKETSGLIFWNNKLWTHNDDTDTNLYALDTISGTILESYSLLGVTNTDWEEIAQDENYIYIGDFGNNTSGNRKDLRILRIDKISLLNKTPKVDYINFGYENQNDFDNKKPNKTNFDCEAFVITQDSIFLFTKEWKTKKTTLYKLPKIPGNYEAEKKVIFNTKGLVTGACLFENKLALCGYTKKGKPFVDLFYDFNDSNFFSGKHIKVKLKSRFSQIEAITSQDGLHYFLTNEQFKIPLVNIPQQINLLDLRKILNDLK
ncbi:MAG: T9SS C-terminal target domain-containing protein [Bacteroidota bacterium]